MEPQRSPGDGPEGRAAVRGSESRNSSQQRRRCSPRSGWRVLLKPVRRTEKPSESLVLQAPEDVFHCVFQSGYKYPVTANRPH